MVFGEFKAAVSRLARDERGATAIEYGLLVALISVAIIGGMNALGTSNNGSWGKTADKASSAMNK